MLFPLSQDSLLSMSRCAGQNYARVTGCLVIYGHPVMAPTRVVCFVVHATKRDGGSGDENGFLKEKGHQFMAS